MATIDIGKLKPVFKGTYDNSTAYVLDDIVYYNGSSYVAKTSTTGNLPTDTTKWNILASGSGGIWDSTLSLGSAGQSVKVNSAGNALEFGTISSGNYSVHANFRTFPNSLLTLVRFATGEGWGDFMYDASESVDGCVDDPEYRNDMCGFNDKPGCTPLNGCGKLEVFPYLLSFTLFVSMVLFNLFVGVIIEGVGIRRRQILLRG